MARILIVDDDEFDRVLGAWILEDSGHEVLFAADGAAALELYESEEIDLVITDLVMPELNGLRLIKALVELDHSAKIIAISGVSPEQLPRAQDLGAVFTLPKPMKRSQVLDVVERALRGEAPTNLFG